MGNTSPKGAGTADPSRNQPSENDPEIPIIISVNSELDSF